ncbi:MAG: hypothetical protein GY816_08340, partial [Cytophagales bacterium]|nr:hypothetical protein [Cytophagales bacterium]
KKCVRFSDIIEERILEEVRKSPEPKDQASTSHKNKQGFKSTDSYFYKVSDTEMEADPLTGVVGEGATILMYGTNNNIQSMGSQEKKTYIRLGPSEIPVMVEDLQLTALIDTGSTLTILASKAAKRLGITQLAPPRQTTARSMTGHTLSFQGSKNVKMKIGDTEFHHEIHVAPDITSIGYDLILGTDLLKHMPPFTINYRNGTATFNNKTLPLGTPTPLRKVNLVNGIFMHGISTPRILMYYAIVQAAVRYRISNNQLTEIDTVVMWVSHYASQHLAEWLFHNDDFLFSTDGGLTTNCAIL